jgi:hypothetical protein
VAGCESVEVVAGRLRIFLLACPKEISVRLCEAFWDAESEVPILFDLSAP